MPIIPCPSGSPSRTATRWPPRISFRCQTRHRRSPRSYGGHARLATSALPPSATPAPISASFRPAARHCAVNDTYWIAQVDVLLKSAQAWHFATGDDAEAAIKTMSAAVDEEDSLEKPSLTPGPIAPAREQLGELFLRLGKPKDALIAFDTALVSAPGGLGALHGKADAEQRISRL